MADSVEQVSRYVVSLKRTPDYRSSSKFAGSQRDSTKQCCRDCALHQDCQRDPGMTV